MPQFKLMNNVILDNGMSLGSIKISKNLYRYTEQGMLIYPIGSVIPVIRKGHGCIGTAIVNKITMDENITTIDFGFTEVDKNTAKVLYSMYRNNVSVNAENNDDPYNTDAVIPGAIGSQVNLAGKSQGSKFMDNIYNTISGGGHRGNRGHGNGSIHDMDDDD